MSLALLYTLAKALEREGTPTYILSDALRSLGCHPPLTRVVLALVAPESGEICIQCTTDAKVTAACQNTAVDTNLIKRALATDKAMYLADGASEAQCLLENTPSTAPKTGHMRLCIPVHLHNTLCGVILAEGWFEADIAVEQTVQLLSIASVMLAHTAYACCTHLPSIACSEAKTSSRPKGFVGNSETMQKVYEQIMQVASSNTTVLVQGESGTGKELVAQAIHDLSGRAEKPFISLNCAALPEGLIESELFGHERGAFTGASAMRKGRFELANGGTLFLDEIGELSLLTQAKLLRVLQERRFERLGGMESRQVDVRIVTATNRDLERMVAEGSFRRDLFYRLNVFPIHLPPLRERLGDILPLATHFSRLFSATNRRETVHISQSVADTLHSYAWPGNIRELENVIERAVLLVGVEGVVLPQHLPPNLYKASGARPSTTHALKIAQRAGEGSLNEQIDTLEQACIIDALSRSNGHMGHAATLLGLTERVMALRMKKHGISYKNFRDSRM